MVDNLIILFGVAVILYFCVQHGKKERKVQQEQILSLFVLRERLTVLRISERLLERTGNKKDLSFASLCSLLDALVEEGRLLVENVIVETNHP